MGSVLVVDDERSMREFLAICLKRAGHQVSVADSGSQALATLESAPVDVVVTDLRMPGDIDGLALLQEVRTRDIGSEVIVVTAFATPETAIAAMRAGAYDYLTKPFKVDEIEAVIRRVMEKRALVAENLALKERVEGRYRLAQLIGKSPQMQRLFELITKVQETRTSVLVTGESGVGKELVARALHFGGPRRSGPFVAVNCGAIPEELLESELFGHVKGAFTGAVADKPGLFPEADQGTLFLDEIGELPINLQVKLLRALQERKIKPVGGTAEIEIDARVVAATNRELEEEVARGAFRSDLYYRLNVIELRIPPLRERSEDIPLLVQNFVRRFAADQAKEISGLTPEALSRLRGYLFPGNVRELENIIEHAVTMAAGELITESDLPELRSRRSGIREATPAGALEEGFSLEAALRDFERELIEKALSQAGGVRKKAARLLGVSFRSFRYRLQKLGLDGDDGE